MAYQSFEKLEVWKRSCRLAVEVCRAMAKSKQFVLKDQMQQAAISMPSNIAEGAERDSKQDFIRFLRIAKRVCGGIADANIHRPETRTPHQTRRRQIRSGNERDFRYATRTHSFPFQTEN